tara:strand:- start:544 stop:1512 length:969 start_codon:yes stop_codon:yes gene_type:complete
MASTPKNLCTHNTEQTITARKTFTDGVAANKFELLDGTELKPPAIEVMKSNVVNRLVVGGGNAKLDTTTDILLAKDTVVVAKEVTAPGFSGDGSKLTNIPSSAISGALPLEQLAHNNACFEIVDEKLSLKLDPSSLLRMSDTGLSVSFSDTPALPDASKFDHILVNSQRSGVGRLSITSLMGHIAAMNSQVLNVVNGGDSLGSGVSLYKGKVTKGRNQHLQFKTLVFDDNFLIREDENHIHIGIKDLALEETKKQQQQLLDEIVSLSTQRTAAQLSTVSALEAQITSTLEEMNQAEKDYKSVIRNSKKELDQLLSTLRAVRD